MSILKVLPAVFVLNLVVFTNVNGQAYHPLLGNKYKWEEFYHEASFCGLTSGALLIEGIDTIISTVSYKTIMKEPILGSGSGITFCPPYIVNDSIQWLKSLLREDTLLRKVFIYSVNTEYLLYDFNVSDGDTLQNYYGSSTSILVVDSVRSINYQGLGLRKTVFANPPGVYLGYFYIEGIGGHFGLTDNGFSGIGSWNELTCVRDSNNNATWGNCMSSFVGLDNHDSYASLNFNYLNSTKDFYVSGEIKSGVAVELIDVSGKLIYSNPKVKPHEAKSISFIKPGIYLYAIHYNGKTNSGRFIVY
jgi:hypothetical protein